ncbi:glycosyltransferase [Egbenema bharatensis]|uniref:glycosyltransferase n=1 Tax=Egbenema bharatensis TaxID=3463334 RepID=UPI003A898CE6
MGQIDLALLLLSSPFLLISLRSFSLPSLILLFLTLLSLIIWLYLLVLRGQFWRSDQQLESASFSLPPTPNSLPSICAVIPARNEADLLPATIRSLLTQDYPGDFTIIVVDDHSTDGTAQAAIEAAESLQQAHRLQVMQAAPLPSGWTGKLWAMEQGVQKAQAAAPDYLLLTDADIQHDALNLYRLSSKAVQDSLSLVSVMVRLRCDSFWERLLIPAFVFFFEKLYPFRWVNDPCNPTAAAAGGCILVRRETLNAIGGIASIRDALIDDCALAQAVKSRPPLLDPDFMGTSKFAPTSDFMGASKFAPTSDFMGASKFAPTDSPYTPIWLGLSDRTLSLRPYSSLKSIWDMVARSAYTQLDYSPLLLAGTVVGMAIVYLIPPLSLILGVGIGSWEIALVGLASWLLMTIAYLPTVQFYQCSPGYALALPGIAFLYNLMTIDSAWRHWRGQGGVWKGRVYERGVRSEK